jgi:hypothetical protein
MAALVYESREGGFHLVKHPRGAVENGCRIPFKVEATEMFTVLLEPKGPVSSAG